MQALAIAADSLARDTLRSESSGLLPAAPMVPAPSRDHALVCNRSGMVPAAWTIPGDILGDCCCYRRNIDGHPLTVRHLDDIRHMGTWHSQDTSYYLGTTGNEPNHRSVSVALGCLIRFTSLADYSLGRSTSGSNLLQAVGQDCVSDRPDRDQLSLRCYHSGPPLPHIQSGERRDRSRPLWAWRRSLARPASLWNGERL